MTTRAWTFSLFVVCLGGCAHDENMTGHEHRAAASVAEHRAEVAKSKYEPDAVAHTMMPRGPAAEFQVETMRDYNPTAGNLAEADRQMRIASKHLSQARRLDVSEDVACAGVSEAERTSCPLLAPHVAAVNESALGISLQLKPSALAQRLAGQMRCHLAYAKANDFERVPCPLYLKGVTITLREERIIEVFSNDAKVAARVRAEARKLFGESQVPVAAK